MNLLWFGNFILGSNEPPQRRPRVYFSKRGFKREIFNMNIISQPHLTKTCFVLGLISQVRVFGTEQLPFLYPFVSNLLSYIQIQRKVNVKPRTNNKPFYTSFMYILSRREKTSHTESSTDFSLTIPISLINKNALTAVFSPLAWRLGQEMRRLILHETGFTR